MWIKSMCTQKAQGKNLAKCQKNAVFSVHKIFFVCLLGAHTFSKKQILRPLDMYLKSYTKRFWIVPVMKNRRGGAWISPKTVTNWTYYPPNFSEPQNIK